MLKNVQSISESSSFTTPETDRTEQQRTLGLGPGRVHRGGKSEIPDNEAFWKSVNAVVFSSRGSGRRSVYRSVAWHVALTDERVCFAAVETIGKQADMGATQTRVHLQALAKDGYIVVDGQRSGGRSATRYRLSTLRVSVPNPPVTVSQPSGYRSVNPPVTGAEVVSEVGTEEVQAAAYVHVETVEKPEAETKQPVTERLRVDRHTCPSCGNDWPASYGTKCFSCNGKRSTAGLAAPEPGKYDFLEQAPRPDQESPLDPEPQAETGNTAASESESQPEIPVTLSTKTGENSRRGFAKQDRHTCPTCGNDWPESYGTKCFSCNGKRSTAGPSVRAEPGKYDDLF